MTRSSRSVASPRVVSIADFRALARRRVPRAVFDYLGGGAEGEVTLRENCRVYEDVTFRPRHAVAVADCSLCTRVLGFDLALPFMLAPVGYSRLMHPVGEVGAARAAGNAGTAYILSTISGHKLEDVKAASTGHVFYQLYLMGGRAAAEAAIERARLAGFSALVVTIDTAVSGIRERDHRNGMKELVSGSVFEKLPFLPQILSRPGWLAGFLLDGGLPALPNVVVPGKGPVPLVDVAAALAESTVTWSDLGWIRDLWRGPIVVKGVLTGDDARRAIDEGAAAISVSNHGGRQLDCVPSSLRVLPEVVKAVNGQTEILMDGGIRRGTDIVKALCLGARAVLCGRAYAYLAVADGEPDAFLLESVEGGEKIGRYTFLGVRPFLRLESRGSEIKIERDRKIVLRTGNVFQVIKELLQQHRPAAMEGLPPFTAGAVGYCAYDIVRRLENIGEHATDDLDVPDCVLMFFDRVLAFDHLRHQIHIVASADVTREAPRVAYDKAVKDIARIEKELAAGWKPAHWRKATAKSKLKVKARTPKQKFLESVRRAKEYIAAGDIFQVVLSQRWDFEPGVAPLDLYRALRTVNPSPYMFFLRVGGEKLGDKTKHSKKRTGAGAMHVLGASPEMLVRVSGSKLEYRPIAGTHPRGTDEAADAALEKTMREDEKERAEHVMLVDLGRNDLGRVSEYGSVKVRDLMYVERYSHVMHLVSALEGRLRPELDAVDALAACFPAGTPSGAPKVRAMQIIEELEPTRRGVYGGAVLYADFAGNLDSCIVIRTLLMKGKKAYLQAGAGIVADSDPQREFEESENKSRAVLRAVEMARGGRE